METGIGGGYVGDITGKNITCRDGFAAVMSEPHSQKNGEFTVDGVLSVGCSVGVLTNGGYVDDKRHPSEGAGHFSNTSSVTNVLGVYGTHAQPEEGIVKWPACTVWGDENAVLNYDVAVTGATAEGFPPPADRTKLVHWERWEASHCYYK
eukprot:m.161219 g.161219  ORF g.161219 m.161219 type:complete len:150 (+) comp23830_c0_seq1:191-640(+)